MTLSRQLRLAPLQVRTPLGLFSVLWGFGSALHTLEDQPLDGLFVYPLVALLLWFPEELWAIAVFALGHALLTSLNLPDAANHSMLAMLVDATLVIGCLLVYRRGDAVAPQRQLWESIKGPLMAVLTVVYFFAVFHKLNTSFFDPAVSCAVTQPMKMLRIHGFTGAMPDVSRFAPNIYFTLVVETAIIVLLCVRRWTHWGALLGLAFHVGLGWARFYDFATVAFALYLFFFPWADVERRLSGIPRWAGATFLGGFAGVALCSVVFYGIRDNPVIVRGTGWDFTVVTLQCAFWTLAVLPVLLPVYRAPVAEPDDALWRGTAIAWAIPVIAVVNGLTSYLGLKTVSNYSMFSNLRTEGGVTNHLLIPASSLFIADYQNDLVHVESYKRAHRGPWPFWIRFTGDGSPRWRSELPDARIPMVELRRTVQEWQRAGVSRAEVVYERGGVRHEVTNAFADPELMKPLRPWERRLMAWRAVSADTAATPCRW